MSKTLIVSQLGESGLLLPSLVNEALAANDRAKYLMTLLQTVRSHVDQPGLGAADLKHERLACGVTDAALDGLAERSFREEDGVYHIPGAGGVHETLVGEVRRMMAPLHAAGGLAGEGPGFEGYEERLEGVLAGAPGPEQDRISGDHIDRITSAHRGGRDSLHLLVMDLHRELNRLQQAIATEVIAGASAYGVRAEDRPLIAAFMAGVRRTAPLKLSHPGLGTTATRAGGRLVIQNDIGMTDAHVLVVHVEPPRVTLTYTDIHIERLLFFQNLFDRYSVRWEDTRSRRAEGMEQDVYHLSRGTYVARDGHDLEEYLAFLGSRLVFLIDWNKARKRLRKLAPRKVCLEVLRWAAENDVGHMGFLTLGGEQLLFDALQAAGRVPLQPGEQLADLLGPERVGELLRLTLRTASEGLRAGRSEALIRDEICAELRNYIDTTHQGFLEIVAEHASLIVELALGMRDGIAHASAAGDRDYLKRAAQRAKRWEHRADELVKKGRTARSRWEDGEVILHLLQCADDAADELEEGVFLLTLLPGEGIAAESFVPLQELAGLLVQGAEEHFKAIQNARSLRRSSPREQVEDFLEAVDRTMTCEHQTDDAHRQAQAGVLEFSGDFKQWYLFSGISDKLEGAADALMRSVLSLRDYVLGEVIRR